jgi:hypothetical protein
MTTFYAIGWALAVGIAIVVIVQAVMIHLEVRAERDGWERAYLAESERLRDLMQQRVKSLDT